MRAIGIAAFALAIAACGYRTSLRVENGLVVESVAIGQADAVQGETSVPVTLVIRNVSSVRETLGGVTPVVSVNGSDRSQDYALTRVGGPDHVAPHETVVATYTMRVAADAAPGTASFNVRVASADGIVESLPAATAVSLPVLTHARLVVTLVETDGAVCRDSRVATLVARVRNDGESVATLAAVTPTIRRAGEDVSAELAVTADPANPTSVAPGAEAQLSWTLGASAATGLGPLSLGVAVIADDARSGVDASPPDEGMPFEVTVHEPGSLTLDAVTETRTTVSKGQTALAVRATFSNQGTTPVDLTSAAPLFTIGAADRTGDYGVVTGALGTVAPGATADVDFTVSVSAGAMSGATVIDAVGSGLDAVCEEAPVSAPALAAGTWIVQSPPSLSVASSLGESTLYAGRTTPFTVTVTNAGEATANAVLPSFSFGGCATCATVTAVAAAATDIAGSATAMYTYTVTAANTAPAPNPTASPVATAVIDASASGTDANTGLAAPSSGSAKTLAVHTMNPKACFRITPATGEMAATSFTFDASCSSDVETPLANLAFAWDADGDGAYDDGTTMTLTRTLPRSSYSCNCSTCCDTCTNPDGTTYACNCVSCNCQTCFRDVENYFPRVRVTDLQNRQGFSEREIVVHDDPNDFGCVTTTVDELNTEDSNVTTGGPTPPYTGMGYSLREAITFANARGESDSICFDPALGNATFTFPMGALPPITGANTHIAGRTGITLDFTGLSTGLVISGDGSSVRDLALTGITVAAPSNNAKIVITRTGVIVRDNRIHGGTAGDGIVITNESGIQILDNLIESNPGRGIFVLKDNQPGSDPYLYRNVIRLNGGHGIEVSATIDEANENGPRAHRNVIHSNGGDGIRVGPGIIDSELLHNTIHANTGAGIRLVDCGFPGCFGDQDLDLGGSLLTGNGDCGIRVDATMVNDVRGRGELMAFGNLAGDFCGYTAKPDDFPAVDPLYLDAAAYEFLPKPLSPARNAATSYGTTVDMNDRAPINFYGTGPEIGALETPP